MNRIKAEDHRGFAASQARAFCRRFPHLQGADIDDARQEAFIAIMEAAVKWDGERPWPPYAWKAIRCRLLKWIRRTGVVALPARSQGGLPAASRSYEDTMPDKEPWLLLMIRDAIKALPERLGTIVLRRYFHGETPELIARSLGVHPKTVYRLQTEALHRLRELL